MTRVKSFSLSSLLAGDHLSVTVSVSDSTNTQTISQILKTNKDKTPSSVKENELPKLFPLFTIFCPGNLQKFSFGNREKRYNSREVKKTEPLGQKMPEEIFSWVSTLQLCPALLPPCVLEGEGMWSGAETLWERRGGTGGTFLLPEQL